MRVNLLAATALSTTVMFLVPGASLAQSSFDWNGFYVGFGIGPAASQSTVTFDYSGTEVMAPTDPIALQGRSTATSVNAGFNVTNGRMLFGVEGDYTNVNLHGTASGSDYFAEERLNALLSLRGRLGIVFDRFMLYGTAGVAAANASFNADLGKGTASGSGIVTGKVIGAGMEYAINDNVTLKAGAKVYDFSTLDGVSDTGKGDTSDPYSATYHPRATVFETGLNVHF